MSQNTDPSKFTRKSVSNISTHRVSIYDPFIPRWTPSLDSRPPFGILSLIPDIAIDRNPAPPQWADLLRLSLISVWSDMRRHRLLPTRRARTDERRLSAASGVTRLTDCASLLFPLHVSHPRHTSVQLSGCPVRTAPPNPQFPPPCAPNQKPICTVSFLLVHFPSHTQRTTCDRCPKCPTSRRNILATRAS